MITISFFQGKTEVRCDTAEEAAAYVKAYDRGTTTKAYKTTRTTPKATISATKTTKKRRPAIRNRWTPAEVSILDSHRNESSSKSVIHNPVLRARHTAQAIRTAFGAVKSQKFFSPAFRDAYRTATRGRVPQEA